MRSGEKESHSEHLAAQPESAPDEDGPTMRVRLPLPVPPPLPNAPKPSDQTPIVALEIPSTRTAMRRPLPGGPYAKLGAALFGAGVLVGALGAVSVLQGRSSHAVDATAPLAARPNVPNVAAFIAPNVLGIEPAAKAPTPIEPKVKPRDVTEVNEPAPDAEQPPVSGSTAPSCRQMLGKSLADRNDPKRANTQTAVANRALVRGNVNEAQAAYCLALAWDRSNIERRLNLARLFLVRRDWAKAAEYGQSALQLDPESRRAFGVVGDAWAALHKTKEAREALLSAERKSSASAAEIRVIVRRNMALAHRVERLRDFALAERLYRRVLLLDPEHAGAVKGVAGCLLKLGDRPAAEAWARKAKALKRASTRSRSSGTE